MTNETGTSDMPLPTKARCLTTKSVVDEFLLPTIKSTLCERLNEVFTQASVRECAVVGDSWSTPPGRATLAGRAAAASEQAAKPFGTRRGERRPD